VPHVAVGLSPGSQWKAETETERWGGKVWSWTAQLMSSLKGGRCCCHCDFRFRTVSAFFPGSSCVDFEVPQNKKKKATQMQL